MKDPAVLIPPIATVASQMVFTDGAYFVITLNVTGPQGATFNTAVCTDSNGNNPVAAPEDRHIALPDHVQQSDFASADSGRLCSEL